MKTTRYVCRDCPNEPCTVDVSNLDYFKDSVPKYCPVTGVPINTWVPGAVEATADTEPHKDTLIRRLVKIEAEVFELRRQFRSHVHGGKI